MIELALTQGDAPRTVANGALSSGVPRARRPYLLDFPLAPGYSPWIKVVPCRCVDT